MRNTIKAVLLSALVFPGTGHFSLKKPVHGSVLVVISIICMYFLFSTVFEMSLELQTKIQNGEMVFDQDKINEVVQEKLATGNYQYLGTSALGFILCWIFGVIDSFRVGHLKDKDGAVAKAF